MQTGPTEAGVRWEYGWQEEGEFHHECGCYLKLALSAVSEGFRTLNKIIYSTQAIQWQANRTHQIAALLLTSICCLSLIFSSNRCMSELRLAITQHWKSVLRHRTRCLSCPWYHNQVKRRFPCAVNKNTYSTQAIQWQANRTHQIATLINTTTTR